MNTEEPKVSQNRLKKEEIVNEASEKAQRAVGVVVTNYQGLTHQQLETFKKGLKAVNAEYVVIKNTLLKRVLADKGLTEEAESMLEQPTGTLFMYADAVEPLKVLAKSVKDLQLPSVKFGIIDGRIVNEAEVAKLATLPPLPQMRAQVLGTLMAPIQGLHRALQWNVQSLVMTLKAIEGKKSNG